MSPGGRPDVKSVTLQDIKRLAGVTGDSLETLVGRLNQAELRCLGRDLHVKRLRTKLEFADAILAKLPEECGLQSSSASSGASGQDKAVVSNECEPLQPPSGPGEVTGESSLGLRCKFDRE